MLRFKDRLDHKDLLVLPCKDQPDLQDLQDLLFRVPQDLQALLFKVQLDLLVLLCKDLLVLLVLLYKDLLDLQDLQEVMRQRARHFCVT